MHPAETGARHPISAAIIAILLGLLVRNLFAVPASTIPGCKRIVRKLIPVAIVLMGAGLDLKNLLSVGLPAICITMACMGVAIASAYYVGRALGLGHKLSLLIGAGTGVCGNSAIVAVAPLIEAEDEELVLSVATVNLFGLLAMLACPLLAEPLHLGAQAFGVWAGTTIHAVPQVVAAGFAHSPEAGSLATLVKLVRVAMLAPLVFVMALVFARQHAAPGQEGPRVIVHYARLVPWFVWGFVAMSALGTLGLIPDMTFEPRGLPGSMSGEHAISMVWMFTRCGKVLLTLAMAAIGLEVDVRQLASVSSKALLAGLVSTVVLAAAGLLFIRLLL